MSIDVLKSHFTEIYNREQNSLFRFCLLRVSEREKALDLTQESFARLWNSMVTGKSPKNPRAFLFVVARHLIIDWYRKIKPVSLESLSEKNDMEGRRTFDFPDERATFMIEVGADAKRVLSMLKKLEPQYREVVYLRFMEDLPPKIIAEMMHLSTNIVSVRINRGMEALRRVMGIKSNQRE